MKIITLEQTLPEIKKGVDTLANVAKVTLGGKGKNVIIANGYEKVQTINDGKRIADQVEVEDEIQNAGVMLARDAANDTNREAGDGTTTTIVLLQAFLEEMMKTETKDVRGLREAIDEVVKEVMAFIDENKRELEPGDLYRIAMNSSLDKDIAKVVSELIEKIGKDGIVSLEDGRSPGVVSEVVLGIRINEGFMSPYMVTDFERMTASLPDCPILMTRKRIMSVKDLTPLWESLQAKNIGYMALFVEDIGDDVLELLVRNRVKGLYNTLVVKTRNMEDIALVTGAEIVTEENGETFSEGVLGWADKVEATKYTTTITGGREEQSVVDEEVEKIKKQRENAESEYEKEQTSQRIARLQGGVSIISIAGENDQQTKEKKLKLEDALHAVKSAMDDGIIEGGGMAMLRASWFLDQLEGEGNRATAELIIAGILRAPFRQILLNADENPNAIEKELAQNEGTGYNVITRKREDFYATGIIDPVKVVKSALKNAVAMGTSIMTSGASIIAKRPKE